MDDDEDCKEAPWGFIATRVQDPPQCITDCRNRFIADLVPENETLDTLCEVLSDKSHSNKQKAFKTLYCCDSHICGVDNRAEGGLDPNVNWIINACQNLGFEPVLDPGPPDTTYSCERSLDEKATGSSCQTPKTSATNTAIQTKGSPDASHHFVANSLRLTSNTMTAPTSTTKTDLAPEPTYTTIQDPSLPASLDPSIMNDDTDKGGDMSTGVKVTVTLSALVAVALVVVLMICFSIRARRKRARDQEQHKHSDSSTPTEPPSPFASTSASHTGPDGTALTPPARLGERRLLSIVSPRRLQMKDDVALLRSPICRPKRIEMIPRRDKTPRYACQARMMPIGALARGADSVSSLAGASSLTSTITSHTAKSNTTIIPSSQTRHLSEAPPDIHGLASPGPPPTRALPCTPLSGPTSPTRAMVRHGDIGVAIGVVPRNPAQGVILPQESLDLCELTEKYARETRNSWGSWGGGGVGVALGRRAGEMSSPMLEEVDLERLGGRY